MTQLRVAYQGEPGAYSEEAVRRMFPAGAEAVPCASFEALFASVADGSVDYAVAPIENSLVGPIQRCRELIAAHAVRVVREIVMPISHCLIGCPGSSLESIRVIESHPAALGQCRTFIEQHPRIDFREADDTAASVRRVMERMDPSCAAIASERAARVYGAVVLASALEDRSDNQTRFALIAREVTTITPNQNDLVEPRAK